ncbi:UpxY family transcription antiterminator [Acidicapsa dinghuensis]|uniref:UpxY family transcription antiterminator n=1 Tax=Acidicapsa dinghuensis TaxID=2218256 RepID=A0ABW1EJK5_9BACT|nr:UpxY family transcription antiterminator [Acidicapsa dinghuensis]
MNSTSERDISHPQWFAVWTRSRQEKIAASMIEALDIPIFLPLKSELHQWSDRKRKITIPLFSGYLFVQMNIAKDSRLQILKVPGVVGFVGNHTGPLPIPDQQIENVRTLLDAGIDYIVGPLLKEGDRVRVIRGSLSGIEGTVVRTGSDTRLILSVDLVRQSLSIRIPSNDVQLIGEQAA